MRARAPASSANLGPGFDVLALALGLYVEVEVVPARSFRMHTSGEGSNLPPNQRHFAARIAIGVAGHDRLAITVRSDIPVGRGLGSSAALAAAAAAAAGAEDPLAVAAAVDGHPENAAASVLGGLVVATTVDEVPVAHAMPLDEQLAFVVLVPERPLPTKQARHALPAHVLHRDAAFNLGRLGLLLAGLADRRRLVRASTEDRLHQAPRTRLFPESVSLLDGLVEAGAVTACWSGAGPSLLAICDGADVAAVVREQGERLLSEQQVPGRSIVLQADRAGLQVS